MFNIYNEDCFKLMERMIDKSVKVDAIITDPPYFMLNHELDRKFDLKEFSNMCSKLTDCIIFFGRGESYFKLNNFLINEGFTFKEEIIWHRAPSSPTLKLIRVHENISILTKNKYKLNEVRIDRLKYYDEFNKTRLVFELSKILKSLNSSNSKILEFINNLDTVCKKDKILNNGLFKISHKIDPVESYLKSYLNGSKLTSIYKCNNKNKEHPTSKPVDLMRILIKLVKKSDEDVIFDPFLGGGSTLEACYKENVNFIGSEILEKYYQISKTRLNKLIEEDL